MQMLVRTLLPSKKRNCDVAKSLFMSTCPPLPLSLSLGAWVPVNSGLETERLEEEEGVGFFFWAV